MRSFSLARAFSSGCESNLGSSTFSQKVHFCRNHEGREAPSLRSKLLGLYDGYLTLLHVSTCPSSEDMRLASWVELFLEALQLELCDGAMCLSL